MLLYDVTYPHGRSMDRGVTWDYLARVAADRRNTGARAACISGEPAVYLLAGGEWARQPGPES